LAEDKAVEMAVGVVVASVETAAVVQLLLLHELAVLLIFFFCVFFKIFSKIKPFFPLQQKKNVNCHCLGNASADHDAPNDFL
jgi:hypothetical protein